jgi:hypothetical protein
MKRKVLFGVLISFLALTLFIGLNVKNNSTNTKVSVEKMSYEPLNLPEVATFIKPTFGDMLVQSDIILEGRILETKKNVKVEFVNKKGSPEDIQAKKLQNLKEDQLTKTTSFVMETKIEVENVIQGSPSSKVIILVQPQTFDGYVPELIQGQKMIFFLCKQDNSDSNRYITIHPHASFFYENESDLVYPVYQEDDFSQFKNLEKSVFLDKVKKFDKSSYKSNLNITYKKSN